MTSKVQPPERCPRQLRSCSVGMHPGGRRWEPSREAVLCSCCGKLSWNLSSLSLGRSFGILGLTQSIYIVRLTRGPPTQSTITKILLSASSTALRRELRECPMESFQGFQEGPGLRSKAGASSHRSFRLLGSFPLWVRVFCLGTTGRRYRIAS